MFSSMTRVGIIGLDKLCQMRSLEGQQRWADLLEQDQVEGTGADWPTPSETEHPDGLA